MKHMKATAPEALNLSPAHAELIHRSAIAPDVARQRGYRTVERAELGQLGFAPAQRLPGLLVPVLGPSGGPVLYQVRPDQPRRDPNSKDGQLKLIKYETPARKRMRLDFPAAVLDRIEDAAEPLWITEGVRKADAAVSAGVDCIALLGVECWRGTRSDGERGPLEDWDAINLRGREVHIAYDSDVMTKASVRDALDGLTAHLALHGARVWWVKLAPGPRNLTGQRAKVGLDDYLAAGGKLDDLLSRAVRPGRLPVRVNGRSLPDLTRNAIAALAHRNDPPTVFRREDNLVESRAAGVAELTPARLRYRLSEAGHWHRISKEGGTTPASPSAEVVQNVAAADDLWPFPVLDRIVSTPVFARDGSLRSTPGYHEPSRSLYLPPEGLTVRRVRQRPSAASVAKAKALIDDLFRDFAFVDQADRAHAWALLLQPFAREMIRGATPMYAVEAPRQGTGKTLLAQAALAPAVGEVSLTAAPHGDDEMEKRLTSIFLGAAQAVVFDNVTRQMNYASLAGALTSQSWQGRMLGQSQVVRTPVLCTWVMTANNPSFSDDLARRMVRVRLDTKMQDPHRRSGFTHSLPSWALEHRGELIWAACTLLSGWVAAGRPGPPDDTPNLGSYGPWRRVLGGVLHLHGVPGFLGNLATADEPADQENLAFLAEYTLREYGPGKWFFLSGLADRLCFGNVALEGISGRDSAQVAQQLGYFFRAHRGQVVGNLVLERAKSRKAAGYGWRFSRVTR